MQMLFRQSVAVHSLGLFSLHGLIKVSAAQSVLYNPDVLLIMSFSSNSRKLPFLIFFFFF